MNSRIAISSLVFLLAVFSGQNVQAQASRTDVPVDSTQSEEVAPIYASPTTLDHAGRIVVPVMINGKGPFRFMVDTGANSSALSPQAVAKLGLVPTDQESMLVSGVTGRSIVGSVTIATLEVGDLKLSNLNLPVIGTTLSDLDGILGVEGFANMRLTVNFVKDSIKLERSDGKRASREFAVMPARFRHGRLLVVEARVNDIPAQAVIDTGAEATLGTDTLQKAIDRRRTRLHTKGTAFVEGVTSDIQQGNLLDASTINFQGVDIEGIRVAYGDFHVFDLWDLQNRQALLVGMDVLGTAEVLVIDYRRREVRVKPLPARILTRTRRGD